MPRGPEDAGVGDGRGDEAVSDLARQYFERELTEAEEERLAGEMASSPESAQEFLDCAASSYLATGLPEPVDPRIPKAPGGSGAGTWFKMGILTAVVGAGAWWWRMDRTAPTGSPAPAVPVQAIQPKIVLPAPAAAVPIPSPERPRYEGLGVVIRMPQPGLVEVRVLDDQDRAVKVIYRGEVQAGEREFTWDRTLEDGREAAPGTYRIEVQSGDKSMRKTVRLAP